MASLQIAIVGLPNVGKSTLFNALLKEQQALAANYPFATIEPNVGVVPVPDPRLEVLAGVVNTKVIKPATIEFVDIAGLVKGASTGEGLGNQFLSHIRECAVICHVIRAFENSDIIREGSISPELDLETIRMELMLADLSTLQKQQQPKGVKDRDLLERWQMVVGFKSALDSQVLSYRLLQDTTEGHTLRSKFGVGGMLIEQLQLVAKELALLTAKTELFVVNVSEEQLMGEGVERLTKRFAKELVVHPEQLVVMCNQIESELATLADEDRFAYLKELGLQQSGLDRLIQAAYRALHLQSFLTAGEKEVRAWTIRRGMTARQAAGVIHTDFERLMISAKVAHYDDFIQQKGWKGVKEAGKMRTEGRDYVMLEGDVVEFLIGK
jgi:ribosome-binding ATPase